MDGQEEKVRKALVLEKEKCVQCAVCSVQCAVCSVQCVVCCMQSSVCNRHKKNHFQDKFASYVIYRFKNMPLD